MNCTSDSNKCNTWTASDIPDLTGKVVIVTGGSRGIGLHTAMGLTSAGAEVIILGRNSTQGEKALIHIREKVPLAIVSYVRVEFGSLVQIAEFARTFNKRGVGLDILVNNAGTYPFGQLQKTMDGFESTFGINHLAPFALTAQLLPSLRRSSSPRVINVSSTSAYYANIKFRDLQYQKSKYYMFNQVYSQSKLANLIFTNELQKKSDLNGWGLTAVSVLPGFVRTDMLEAAVNRQLLGLGTFFKWVIQPCITITPEEGSKYSLFAATSPYVEPNGFYGPPRSYFAWFGPIHKIWKPRLATDSAVSERLWKISEYMTQVKWD